MPFSTSPAGLPDTTSITGKEIVERDWSVTSLSAMQAWPSSLRSTLALMLAWSGRNGESKKR